MVDFILPNSISSRNLIDYTLTNSAYISNLINLQDSTNYFYAKNIKQSFTFGNEFGLTYIFISHDLSVVKYMSDRMVVMQQGEIEEMGDADQIYHNPKTEYTRKLIEAIPEGKIEDIEKHHKIQNIK